MASPEVKSTADVTEAKYAIVKALQSGRGDEIRSNGETLLISEVLTNGSLGHGTALRGSCDLDLVLYSESLTGENINEKEGLEDWPNCLLQVLLRRLPRRITEIKIIFVGLQFKLDGCIKVDLLLSPLWREPHEYYSFLQSIRSKKRARFSVGCSYWQVAFFKKQPIEVKEMIKRAKEWKNKMWWSKDIPGKPSSYLLSVLVLRAFENVRTNLGRKPKPPFPTLSLETTKELKKIVKEHHSIDIYWEEYYNKDTYPDLFPTYPPRIVDPANPVSNLYRTGITAGHTGGKWDHITSIIHTLDLTQDCS